MFAKQLPFTESHFPVIKCRELKKISGSGGGSKREGRA